MTRFEFYFHNHRLIFHDGFSGYPLVPLCLLWCVFHVAIPMIILGPRAVVKLSKERQNTGGIPLLRDAPSAATHHG